MTGGVDEAAQAPVGRRARRWRVGLALAIGLLAGANVVWQSSHATFTGTTGNDANTVGAGAVVLGDNDAGSVLISTTNLLPGGAVQTACVGVRYTGTIAPAAIRLYVTSPQERDGVAGSWVSWAATGTAQMDDYMTFSIEVNDTDMAAAPVSGSDCTPAGYNAYNPTPVLAGSVGSLKSFIGSSSSYATGIAAQWGTVAAGKWRVFRFSYSLPASSPDPASGDGVKFNVVWETRSR